jgi:hypothetical protein
MLLKSVQLVDELKNDKVLLNLLKASLQNTVETLKKSNGFLPETHDSDLSKEASKNHKARFCDGISGVVPMLALASEVFPELKGPLLESA